MELKQIANNIRINIINQVAEASSGHPGGSLSASEILTALYFDVMNLPSFDDPNRDRFILSKGHASPVLYAALAEKGAFPKEELLTFRKIGSRLQGHPDMHKLPGVEMTAGSLGIGVGVSVGVALGAKLDEAKYNVFTLIGDGEIQEGSVWEAFMAAAHYKLDNFIAIIDNNNLQIDGTIEEVMSPYPIDEKMKAFGFNVININDGNDIEQVIKALREAKEMCNSKPTAVIAKTVKGKGVSFMENNGSWHGTAPNAEQRAKALEELGGNN